jgi:hypothetical protein
VRRLSLSPLVGAGLGLIVTVVPRTAAAFENEWHVGAKGGLSMLSGMGVGPAVGIHGAYGLSDMFDAELELLGSSNSAGPSFWCKATTPSAPPASGAEPPCTNIYAATAGLTYKVDILRVIPYVGALGGYYNYAGAPGPNGESGGQVGAAAQVGFDFLATREIAVSLDYRVHFSFLGDFYSPFQTLLLGAEYRFGF